MASVRALGEILARTKIETISWGIPVGVGLCLGVADGAGVGWGVEVGVGVGVGSGRRGWRNNGRGVNRTQADN